MENWIPFVLASSIILVLPGPTIILVISQSVNHGRKSVVPLVAGVLFGDFTAMTLSLLGLGAVLSASAFLFSIFKWCGAFYLMYLGVKLWMTNPRPGEDGPIRRNTSAKALFRSSYIVTALNPKSIAFFVAFLPQFIDSAKPVLSQMIILGATFLVLATLNAAMYAIFAGQLSSHMKNKNIRTCFNRAGAGALVGAGIVTAALKQN
jgi:threonine/homoserine/homoserine lactone efflux protein